jgi:hypothetical protein
VWQLPHCVERFLPPARTEASWESTGVNARPFGSAGHSSASFLASCQAWQRDWSCQSVTVRVAGPALFCLVVPRQQVAALPGHGRGLLSALWIRGVPEPAAWPASRRQKIRTHRMAAGPRHCRMVSHRFPVAKSHPQDHLREEDEGSRCPGYI